jgi:predicted phosphodiesterase
MAKSIDKSGVAQQYCKQYPSTPTYQLARILRREEPLLFDSDEHARRIVRYVRGQSGESDAARAARGGKVAVIDELPQADSVEYAEYELAGGLRYLVLADLHVPYHDRQAIAQALEWGKANGCDGVLLLGDVADCYSLSSWLRDPRAREFCEEVDAVGHLLDAIKTTLKPKRFIWKAGNHEYRLERFLMARAAELFGMREFTYESFLGLNDMGIEWIGQATRVKHKALTLVHGHEWRGGATSPVNPARTAYLKCKECAVCAHQHKTSEHTETTVVGVMKTCWSVGCLCNLHPDYAPLNAWNHGFGCLDTRGSWRFENYRIKDGEIL